ncbi:hypothetical protein O181_079249 [Austropuccinia psidii MF-1]|uniref:Uncharacterized protein n=1 Tax=Austropuccinia psidii MF-1 TaxID=1389203 RepID=A0A9Q3FI44_9BASI|nr:hypothetical protein [Austropuccinia psidii MF-1]
MTTRRGSQYSIQSDGGGLRSGLDPSKGKKREKSQWNTIHTRKCHIQKASPDMPMISEPELELSMCNSNREKSHLEGSNRHLYEPVQAVLQSVQDHSEKSDEAIMNLKDHIQSEIRLITEKMDKINEAILNMPNLSTPFSHIRSLVKPKEEIKNPFMTDLSNQENNQVLMKEAPQLKEWPTFAGEGEYDHM